MTADATFSRFAADVPEGGADGAGLGFTAAAAAAATRTAIDATIAALTAAGAHAVVHEEHAAREHVGQITGVIYLNPSTAEAVLTKAQQTEAPIWCVTTEAVTATPEDAAPDPARAAIWGLGRVIALEHPTRWGGLIDLPTLDETFLSRLPEALAGNEDQVAIRPGGTYARRLTPTTHPAAPSTNTSPQPATPTTGTGSSPRSAALPTRNGDGTGYGAGAGHDAGNGSVNSTSTAHDLGNNTSTSTSHGPGTGASRHPATSLTSAPSSGTSRWRPSGTVLITGGTGALGAHVARWVAKHGADRLVLTSRRGLEAPGARELQADLQATGTLTIVAACNVSDRDALAALARTLREDGPPVTAVIHTAGIGHLTLGRHHPGAPPRSASREGRRRSPPRRALRRYGSFHPVLLGGRHLG